MIYSINYKISDWFSQFGCRKKQVGSRGEKFEKHADLVTQAYVTDFTLTQYLGEPQ